MGIPMDPPNLTPKVNSPRKLLVLTLGVMFAYALGELLTRIFVPDPAFQFENRIEMFQEDPIVGYKNKPNYVGYAEGFIRIETNSLGYRGKEVTLQKPPRTFRILGLGDSVMWGAGVQDSETYLRLLERELNQSFSATTHLRFEIVNTGVIGYSTHQELLTLQRDGIRLSPDVVVVGFELNDSYPTEDPFYNVGTFHQPSKDNVRRRAYSPTPPVRLYFYRFLRSQARSLRSELSSNKQATPVHKQEEWLPGSFEDRNWPVMQCHFRTMKRLSDEQGFHLLILLFPTADQLDSSAEHPVPQARVAKFLASEAIDHLDLLDVFPNKGREVFWDYMHLTPTGHRLVARAILHYLIEHHWLDAMATRSSRVAVSP
jgi:lysophospholipase L1-like esterase